MNFDKKYNEIKNLVSDDMYNIENSLLDFYCGAEDLQTNLLAIIKAPSKRLRPLLAVLYLKMYGVEITNDQIQLQAAVELIHNATLIHDDVIDNSAKRRNKTTLNELFDNSLAVVTGDFLLSIAIQKLLNIKSSDILQFFSIAIKRMCIGEIQQYFNKFKVINFDEYLDKCRYKTAELFIASLTSCATIANLDVNSAKDFAKRFGIAFQIRDDLLNIIESNSDKPCGNDIKDGIYTAPVIFAKGLDNINYGIEKTKELLDNYFNRVKKCLDNAPENEYKQAILELIEIMKIC